MCKVLAVDGNKLNIIILKAAKIIYASIHVTCL